jgi:hypothetical protein
MNTIEPPVCPRCGGDDCHVCRHCGCTDCDGCRGGCAWVDLEETVCSKCAIVALPRFVRRSKRGVTVDLGRTIKSLAIDDEPLNYLILWHTFKDLVQPLSKPGVRILGRCVECGRRGRVVESREQDLLCFAHAGEAESRRPIAFPLVPSW